MFICYSGGHEPRPLYSMIEVLWIGCLLLFLSFVLVFTFTRSKGTRVCSSLFISNSEADVPELLLIVRSNSMAKYESL